MSEAIILFGHGARDPEWARPMQRLAAAIESAAPDARVALAFLEFMSPTLPEAAAKLVAEGATQLRVVPVFLAQGGHVRRDVPMMLDTIRAQHAGVGIVLLPAIGESQPVIDAMAQVVLAAGTHS
jgi:sirohydrochlorin cobaltochelatase